MEYILPTRSVMLWMILIFSQIILIISTIILCKKQKKDRELTQSMVSRSSVGPVGKPPTSSRAVKNGDSATNPKKLEQVDINTNLNAPSIPRSSPAPTAPTKTTGAASLEKKPESEEKKVSEAGGKGEKSKAEQKPEGGGGAGEANKKPEIKEMDITLDESMKVKQSDAADNPPDDVKDKTASHAGGKPTSEKAGKASEKQPQENGGSEKAAKGSEKQPSEKGTKGASEKAKAGASEKAKAGGSDKEKASKRTSEKN